ncbi:MAG: PrsW family intramembrane metalloprotease [Candidatus Krumholzibacteriota bacterium]|nr:PrsW family intramembrane metalloprotease [Candidatus Krumholzibacteriota bacterium]
MKILVSVLPVLAYLVVLVFLDSFKLVRPRALLWALLVGCGAALVSRFVNGRLFTALGWDLGLYSRYLSPVIEEAAKGLFLVHLIRSRRVGFLVDAAILGFAVGAGFAVVENLHYLAGLPAADLLLWIIRGFGTAIMHGGAAALFALMAQSLAERRQAASWSPFLPALLLAAVVHSLYNHFLVSPLLATLGLVGGIPLVTVLVYRRSERALRAWMDIGMDGEMRMLAMITRGEFLRTRTGRYLLSLKERFPGHVVADMLCLLRLHLELSLQAKGLLLMREAGYTPAADPATREKLAELAFLERSIGPTGKLAVMPVLRWRRRDLWQMYLLRES